MRIGPATVAEAVCYANNVAEIKIEHGEVDLCTKSCTKIVEMKLGVLWLEYDFLILVVNSSVHGEAVFKPSV